MRWLLPLVALCACMGPTVEPKLVSPGVGETIVETRALQTDAVHVHVWFPARPDATPVPGPHAAMIFVQGGFVPVERYAWQAERLAQEGFIVLAPEFPEDLAFFFVDAGNATVELAKNPGGTFLEGLIDASRIAVAGHSLGGVVAVKLALQTPVAALVVQASYADPADVAKLPALGTPVLSLAGEKDCSASLDSVRAGWNQFSSPTALVVMPGQTHYQFTDSEAEDLPKCTPSVSLEVAHARIMDAEISFLHLALDGAALTDFKPAGSTTEVR